MMKINKIELWEIKLLMIINKKLYEKNDIDEKLYFKTRDKLLLMFKNKGGQDVIGLD